MNRRQDNIQQPIDQYPIEDDYDNFINTEGDNSRWELEYGDVIANFEHSLRCEKQLPNGTWSIPQGSRPKMNDTGIADFISDLKIIMHKGTALGNISLDYANLQVNKISKAFARKLVFNTKSWGIDKNQRKMLVLEYASQTFLTMTRPIGDKERSHRSKKFGYSEVYKHDEVRPDEIKI